jgi:hypothetical protein
MPVGEQKNGISIRRPSTVVERSIFEMSTR